MSNVIQIESITIKQDEEGRYCLNDLHKAAGGENRHRPSLWLANDQAQALVIEIESEAGITALDTQHGGKTPGTFVVRELVYAYAMWISPAFNLKVIRAFRVAIREDSSCAKTPIQSTIQDYIWAYEKPRGLVLWVDVWSLCPSPPVTP